MERIGALRHGNATNTVLQVVLPVTGPGWFDESRIETRIYQLECRRPMRSSEQVVISLTQMEP